ncbi:MAG TPA: methylamine utilization protein, partial [Candidatus Ozemobacteraceae bacterium]|nr:methylamine utilization protein [Candidatus Ozemobacteraceae bacterium]
SAEQLQLTVVDTSEKPVADAVVVIRGDGLAPLPATGPALITQHDKTFRPLVTVIRIGTAVEFPNEDDIMHHVYSFSKPKKFDIPLYKDKKPEPVIFEQPGVVTLGCNIHDWMKAFIYVTDAPVFGKTSETGTLAFTVPVGTCAIDVWHPRLKKVQGDPLPRQVTIIRGAPSDLRIVLELKKSSTPSRAPTLDTGGSY